MKTNKLVLGLALFALVLGTGISVASAYPGDGSKKGFDPEKRQEMREVIENGDYQAWEIMMNEKAELMGQRFQEMKGNITQERFEQMKQIHQLIQEGKYDEAKELKEGLGLDGFGGRGFRKAPCQK